MLSRQRGERGITIVVFALLLVTLLVFAAMAVDLGALYNHRRQDQNAADAGALAAAQELAGTEGDIATAAKQYAEQTLGDPLTTAEWNSCDGDTGALSSQVVGSNCISYSNRRVRVRVPDQYYDAMFGGIVGSGQLRHGAFAIAGVVTEGFGGVLPFAVTGTSANGGFGCLQSNSNGPASDWCGSSSGNFGFLNFTQYGETEFVPNESCGNGQIGDRIQNNAAMGVDHDLSVVGEVYSGLVVDQDACEADPNIESPNGAGKQTGDQSTDAEYGFFNRSTLFPDGQPSRLRRQDSRLFNGSGSRITVHGVTGLDNNNLWRFIPADYGPGEATDADIPVSCKRDQFVNSSGSYYSYSSANRTPNPDLNDAVENGLWNLPQQSRILALLVRCFNHYQGQSWSGQPVNASISPPESPGTGCNDGASSACLAPVFGVDSAVESPNLYDIQLTPRFGYVPQIAAFGRGSSGNVQFERFRAIFIYRLFIEVSGPDTVFDPGMTTPPPTTGNYQRLGETSAFVFPDTMLPNGLAGRSAPFDLGVNRFVRLVR